MAAHSIAEQRTMVHRAAYSGSLNCKAAYSGAFGA